MATTFAKIIPKYKGMSNSQVDLTSFYGGDSNGRSLQITVGDFVGHKFACLNESDVISLCDELNRWLRREHLTEIE